MTKKITINQTPNIVTKVKTNKTSVTSLQVGGAGDGQSGYSGFSGYSGVGLSGTADLISDLILYQV